MRSNWLCGAALLACAALGAQPAAVEPYTWTENFQGGNLGQFSSYPPAQDAGYDPTLAPAPGGGLMRAVRPSRSGAVRFGFIRRLDMVSAAAGRLSFSYRLDHTRAEDRIEIGIAGADGKRYTTTMPIEPGAWRTAQISLARMADPTGRAMPPHTGIEALYLVANLKRADADITYRFLIRGLALEGGREMGFDVRRPRAVRIAHWPELFSTQSFEPGQTVRIEAAAPVALQKAECASLGADGRTRGHVGTARGWARSLVGRRSARRRRPASRLCCCAGLPPMGAAFPRGCACCGLRPGRRRIRGCFSARRIARGCGRGPRIRTMLRSGAGSWRRPKRRGAGRGWKAAPLYSRCSTRCFCCRRSRGISTL